MMGHGKGETATHISARLNRYRIVEALVKADITGTPNSQDACGRTPLHVACEQGYDTIAKLLLQNGADPNMVDMRHRQPLHYAADGGHLASCKLLLDFGSLVDVRDEEGHTAVDLAGESGHEGCCFVILNRAMQLAMGPNGEFDLMDDIDDCRDLELEPSGKHASLSEQPLPVETAAHDGPALKKKQAAAGAGSAQSAALARRAWKSSMREGERWASMMTIQLAREVREGRKTLSQVVDSIRAKEKESKGVGDSEKRACSGSGAGAGGVLPSSGLATGHTSAVARLGRDGNGGGEGGDSTGAVGGASSSTRIAASGGDHGGGADGDSACAGPVEGPGDGGVIGAGELGLGMDLDLLGGKMGSGIGDRCDECEGLGLVTSLLLGAIRKQEGGAGKKTEGEPCESAAGSASIEGASMSLPGPGSRQSGEAVSKASAGGSCSSDGGN